MRRQRNNVARLPFEARKLACQLLHDGETLDGVRAAVAKQFPGTPRLHNTSLLAYQKSAEYREYVEARRQWEPKLARRRWASEVLQQGAGPQNLADVAELAILEQLATLAEGGLLETGKDVATVARAITSMQRTQLARAQAAKDAEIARLTAAAEAERAALGAKIAALGTEIERLRNPQAEDLSGLSEAEKTQRIRQRIGIE